MGGVQRDIFNRKVANFSDLREMNFFWMLVFGKSVPSHLGGSRMTLKSGLIDVTNLRDLACVSSTWATPVCKKTFSIDLARII